MMCQTVFSATAAAVAVDLTDWMIVAVGMSSVLSGCLSADAVVDTVFLELSGHLHPALRADMTEECSSVVMMVLAALRLVVGKTAMMKVHLAGRLWIDSDFDLGMKGLRLRVVHCSVLDSDQKMDRADFRIHLRDLLRSDRLGIDRAEMLADFLAGHLDQIMDQSKVVDFRKMALKADLILFDCRKAVRFLDFVLGSRMILLLLFGRWGMNLMKDQGLLFGPPLDLVQMATEQMMKPDLSDHLVSRIEKMMGLTMKKDLSDH
jgi:hypothetical protein